MPSTISSHSKRANDGLGGRRWLKNVFNACDSPEEEDGMSRTRRLLTSPIPGPPKTLISSLELPPLSEMGIMLSSH